MVINMEWGNFDVKKRCLPFTRYDEDLDNASLNKKVQLYEKMISGMYLGELARLALLDLLNHRVILSSHKEEPWKGTFDTHGSLDTAALSAIVGDSSAELDTVRNILDKVKVFHSSLGDRKVVQHVCSLIGRRAAVLSAIGVAAIVSHTGKAGQGCTIAIDGSVYEKYPNFRDIMQEALNEVLGNEFASNIRLDLSKDGSGLGAALLAALAK